MKNEEDQYESVVGIRAWSDAVRHWFHLAGTSNAQPANEVIPLRGRLTNGCKLDSKSVTGFSPLFLPA